VVGEPTLSRRQAAGSESARGLLFTVLGEFVRPGGGTAWTSAVIDTLGRLDVEEKAARQALMRTASDGWLSSERLGRRTRWTLTEAARRLLTDGADRIFTFTGTALAWDGHWLLALARVPEIDRRTRHLLRTRLAWAGFGSPAPGVWISAHPERRDEAARVLADAGVLDAHLFVAEHAGREEIADLVRQAWDLRALDGEYRDFLGTFSARPAVDPLAGLIDLVHSWRRFPWVDPTLPAQLLPADWSGTRAVTLFARQHARWSSEAAATWRALNQ
jgi:phenylacetic acid degradation operon negative regulatory protein